MAFDAKLYFTDSGGSSTGNAMKILECDFGFTQNIDHLTGLPNAYPLPTNISILVESTNDTQFTDWMAAPLGGKNGKIEFTIRNNNKKILEFVEGYCIQYHETFNHIGEESPMHINITISAKKIIVDGIEFKRPDSDDS